MEVKVETTNQGHAGTAKDPAASPRLSDKALAAKRAAVSTAANGGGSIRPPVAGTDVEETGTPAPPLPREDVESLDIELRDGRTVHFGPPAGVALQIRISSILGANLNSYTASLMRTLMSVRAIDDKKIAPVSSELDAQRLANLLGEDAVDVLQLALNTYWPPATVADLRVIKKNLR